MAAILVIDNDSTDRRMLNYILQKDGHRVITAAHGREALEWLQEAQVDLVITELHMPILDDMSFLQRLHGIENAARPSVIVLTRSEHKQNRQRIMQAGANAFLTKPTSSRELLQVVNHLLQQRLSNSALQLEEQAYLDRSLAITEG